ncbi:FAD-dependent oxidoreductase [Nonomuraea sp. NPDC049709]|uniref:FAD-dependent oxidoreductase n=1 Tax=Nonomuraea sp. NPDC049709 TaxID=3154736 RepID=UPI0034330866
MRCCVIGAGLAGTLLAWRLKTAAPRDEICLCTGDPAAADATAASGGLVRGYEPDPAAARLAADSLAELRASAVLCDWADYRETGSVYVRAAPVESAPPRAELLSGTALAALGLHGVPYEATAVVERWAGHISPHRLRLMALGDFRRRGGEVVAGKVARVGERGDAAEIVAGGRHRRFDVAVVAAGPWTPALLARSGAAGPAVRTKHIQYQVYDVSGPRPPAFVDETTGLYGRPYGRHGLLLGVPSEEWDVGPGRPPASPGACRDTEAAARTRLPDLRLLRRVRTVTACDAYTDGRLLSLARLGRHLYTFTGGSGGAAKLALAASREAAACLRADRPLPADPLPLLLAATRRTEP